MSRSCRGECACVDYKLITYYRQSLGGHCLSGILPQGFLSVKTDRDQAVRRFFCLGMAIMRVLVPIGKPDPARSVLHWSHEMLPWADPFGRAAQGPPSVTMFSGRYRFPGPSSFMARFSPGHEVVAMEKEM